MRRGKSGARWREDGGIEGEKNEKKKRKKKRKEEK